jgi:hypothetical protein
MDKVPLDVVERSFAALRMTRGRGGIASALAGLAMTLKPTVLMPFRRSVVPTIVGVGS